MFQTWAVMMLTVQLCARWRQALGTELVGC